MPRRVIGGKASGDGQVKVRNIKFLLARSSKRCTIQCTYLSPSLSASLGTVEPKLGRLRAGCLKLPWSLESLRQQRKQAKVRNITFLICKSSKHTINLPPPTPPASRFAPAVYCCVVCTPEWTRRTKKTDKSFNNPPGGTINTFLQQNIM